MTAWQLRDYMIQAGHFGDFIAAWKAGVVPLRRRFGFEIQAWTVPAESRLIWILRYTGPTTFEEADQAYYDSPERAAIDPDPARWIAEARKSWLTPVEEAASE
jgi:hypothetical protein